LRRKINGFILFIMFVGILITGLLSNSLVQRNYTDNVREKLTDYARLIGGQMEGHTFEEELAFIEGLARETGSRVTLIGPEGRVFYDSDADQDRMDNHGDRPEVVEAQTEGFGVSKRFSDTVQFDMYYVALAIDHPQISVVRLSLPLDQINRYNLEVLRQIVIAAIIGLVLAGVLSIKYLDVILAPINTLSQATKEIASGQFGKKIYIESRDEIGELARNFNRMSEELKVKVSDLGEQTNRIRAILMAMQNGVVAVSTDRKIIFANPSAERLFGFKEEAVIGKGILEVIRAYEVDSLLDGDRMGERQEMVHGDQILSVYARPIESDDPSTPVIGTLIVFQDITEMRRLEIMRRDFVANVSHELKTPLTSIKGFVETLREGAAENVAVRDRFLGIIFKETERLTSLIEDLLVLSEIEKREREVVDERIDVSSVCDEVREMLLPAAEKKAIALRYEVGASLPEINGNPHRFKQMLINLLDNAIKYTPDQGQVHFTLARELEDLVITISDNGIGIDAEHLDRLFERFYRVDKARSRQVGGTGLGLAIVKHVVLSLGGTIQVTSEPGEGTTFVVRIPGVHS
jgi:two-component system phosphate regulon sensor histidine kinase PhoR